MRCFHIPGYIIQFFYFNNDKQEKFFWVCHFDQEELPKFGALWDTEPHSLNTPTVFDSILAANKAILLDISLRSFILTQKDSYGYHVSMPDGGKATYSIFKLGFQNEK